ncbi:MAG: hypothetical protein RIT24_1495 [Planctomycetota bacterium]
MPALFGEFRETQYREVVEASFKRERSQMSTFLAREH